MIDLYIKLNILNFSTFGKKERTKNSYRSLGYKKIKDKNWKGRLYFDALWR